MKKKTGVAYLAAVFIICLLPSVGMLWKHDDGSAENRKLAELPSLRTQQGWNTDFLPELGEYFEEHFAYRQEMVTADAMLRSGILGVSTEDGVIDGKDGWLFYKDSLDDYLGTDPLSGRAIYNIARTLRLIQDYVEDSGRNFLFTVAPNKNSLYGEFMPYYYSVKVSEEHNIDRLRSELAAQEVNYMDLYPLFEAEDEILYHKRDSHWNNKGAAMAADALLEALEKEHRPLSEMEFEVRKDFEGDLEKMLTPKRIVPEEEFYCTEDFTYEYTGEVESNFDPDIQTVCEGKSGSLLMYRDSFGNALLPFLAEEYENARFTRGVPYYLDDMMFCSADDVIIERAERFLPDMAENPPVFQSPEVEEVLSRLPDAVTPQENDTNCEVTDDGLFVKLSGVIDERLLETDSRIYLCIDGETVYEAFPMSVSSDDCRIDSGYAVYIEKERLLDEEINITLYLERGDQLVQVYGSAAALEIIM